MDFKIVDKRPKYILDQINENEPKKDKNLT